MATRIRALILMVGLCLLSAGCQLWPDRRDPSLAKSQTKTPPALDNTAVPLDAKRRADIQLAFAQVAEQRNDYENAMQAYYAVLELDPNRWDACHRLALIYDRMGNSGDAEILYQRIAELGHLNAAVLCDFGYNLYLQERWAEAESKFCDALTLDPRNRRAHNHLGMLLARTGRYDQSLAEFRNAGLNEHDARMNLALAMLMEGHVERAQQELHILRTQPLPPRSADRIANLDHWIQQASGSRERIARH